MNDENYEIWKPSPKLPTGRLYCDAVHDDYEGFRILLRSDDQTSGVLRVSFESAVGYQNINESFRLETLSRLGGGGLFLVRDSSWVKWLKLESGGMLDSKQLVHYAIYTEEDCIDVVSEFPPEVDWLSP